MKWKFLIGKTIVGINRDAANCINLLVKDKDDRHSNITIDTEAIGHGLYAPCLISTESYGTNNLWYDTTWIE